MSRALKVFAVLAACLLHEIVLWPFMERPGLCVVDEGRDRSVFGGVSNVGVLIAQNHNRLSRCALSDKVFELGFIRRAWKPERTIEFAAGRDKEINAAGLAALGETTPNRVHVENEPWAFGGHGEGANARMLVTECQMANVNGIFKNLCRSLACVRQFDGADDEFPNGRLLNRWSSNHQPRALVKHHLIKLTAGYLPLVPTQYEREKCGNDQQPVELHLLSLYAQRFLFACIFLVAWACAHWGMVYLDRSLWLRGRRDRLWAGVRCAALLACSAVFSWWFIFLILSHA